MTELPYPLFEARVVDCMTAPVVTIGPEDSARAAAETMLRLHVSGLPVVDAHGRPLGVVSESDFRFADAATRRKQREAWVKILSGGQEMAADYLAVLEREGGSVRQMMAAPAICIDESAGIEEAGALLDEYRIKRLPVLRDGVVVGVVTRAGLLRFFAPQAPPRSMPLTPAFFEEVVGEAPVSKSGPDKSRPAGAAGADRVTAAELKNLVAQFERNKSRMREDAQRLGKQKREEQVKLLLQSRFTDLEFAQLLTRAREAAARGETGAPALRFPCALCTDGGRAINLPDPDWPATLRGKAADFFLRWDRELRPLGFALTARIVSFPDGFPGDAELSLAWGR
ncbi:CBS domain-containing protein [uncultured Rhodoblastus sp.]|uniref:CBS domain-containing protein n=1 Tax=uncultured Rhodoblastus sp. TaxID=543037 RepID=UPI0025CCA7E8|nr:CBS domain-containing protein [uncultured Rhodoblastus sp.]